MHECTTKNNINAKNTHCPKFHRNLNVYHALLCSKVSEFSCVRQPVSQLECASNSLDISFRSFLTYFACVVFTLEINSFGHTSSSNPSSLLLQHVVRKRITSHHMDFAVFFFRKTKNIFFFLKLIQIDS